MTSIEKYDKVFEVGEYYLKGMGNSEIAARTGLSVNEVSKNVTEYQMLVSSAARHNMSVTERVYEIIEEVDRHYAMITKEAWVNKENAEDAFEFGQVNSALKTIAQVQKQRAEMHKHLFENQDELLMEELEEQRIRQEQLIGILRTLKNKFPEAAEYIQYELQRLTEDVVEVVED